MVAIILGIVVLGEHITPLVLAGIALILIGVTLVRGRMPHIRARAKRSDSDQQKPPSDAAPNGALLPR